MAGLTKEQKAAKEAAALALLNNAENKPAGNIPPNTENNQVPPPLNPNVMPPKTDQMVPMSDVRRMLAEQAAETKQLIADMMSADKKAMLPTRTKKTTVHQCHMWRFDAKWVVDFTNKNTDEYIKNKVHAFQQYNADKKEFEAWIELVFHDGSKKPVPLKTYVANRTPIWVPIIKRHQKDISYSEGQVEKKKDSGDAMNMQGTGIYIEQEVVMYEEEFEVKTPDGEIFMLPSYVIA